MRSSDIRWLERTERIVGSDAIEKMRKTHVAIFGIGGVGGYVCEALCRSGIGRFTIVDSDTVDITNLNRQIIATRDTIGRSKTEVMKERMLSINSEVSVNAMDVFYLPENADEFDFNGIDYIVDAVDTVSAKFAIIERAKTLDIPIISAMGAGNKLDPSRFKVADIYETSVCPLAKVMRKGLRERGINSLKTVYSDEPPIDVGGRTPGSLAFAPAAAGLVIASEVVRDVLQNRYA